LELDMTTHVIVKCPNPNHNEVVVEKVSKGMDGVETVTERVHLAKGQEHTFYVYATQTLNIKEVPV
jgi:hypothetical protein